MQDAAVTINLYSVHYEESYWKDPHVFRPERHLSEDGTKLLKHSHLFLFGAGETVSSIS